MSNTIRNDESRPFHDRVLQIEDVCFYQRNRNHRSHPCIQKLTSIVPSVRSGGTLHGRTHFNKRHVTLHNPSHLSQKTTRTTNKRTKNHHSHVGSSQIPSPSLGHCVSTVEMKSCRHSDQHHEK